MLEELEKAEDPNKETKNEISLGPVQDIDWNKCIDLMPIDREIEMTPHILETIRKCALDGGTDEEICMFCNFSKRKWEKYLRDNDNFRDWVERLKKKTDFVAKRVICEAIALGSVNESKWWLERGDRINAKLRSEQIKSTVDELSPDDEQILEGFITRTVTYKQTITQKIPLKEAKDPNLIKNITPTEKN